ncbi:MAG: chorismate-binding protein, partial [Myxococcaceae bacterium]|nr:chorismate-binding protein [Myxococcaceae bacterium]
PGSLELAVALRCAHVRGRRATLFVGAGIVRGSTPDAEWNETCRKARAMLEALGVPPATAASLPALFEPAAQLTERRS